MWKEVLPTRKKEVLSSHLISSSHVSHSRQSISNRHRHRQKNRWEPAQQFTCVCVIKDLKIQPIFDILQQKTVMLETGKSQCNVHKSAPFINALCNDRKYLNIAKLTSIIETDTLTFNSSGNEFHVMIYHFVVTIILLETYSHVKYSLLLDL